MKAIWSVPDGQIYILTLVTTEKFGPAKNSNLWFYWKHFSGGQSNNKEGFGQISGGLRGGGGRVMPQYEGLQTKESCYWHYIITFPERHKVCDR